MGKRTLTTCIYALIAPENKVYVGQTTDLINSRSRYKTMTCKNQRLVYESLLKYGYDKHSFVVLMNFDRGVERDKLDFHEDLFFKLYERAGYKLLNLKSAGWNGKPCKESLDRLSDSHIGQVAWNKGLVGAQKAWNKGLKKSDYGNRK